MGNKLSDREIQVLNLAAQGHIDESIGRALDISISTVRGYWLRIRSKLGGASRAELVGKWVALQSEAEKTLTNGRFEKEILAAERSTEEALRAERRAMDKILKGLSPDQRQQINELRKATDGRRQSSRSASSDEREQQTSNDS